jgi:hypothetical protein
VLCLPAIEFCHLLFLPGRNLGGVVLVHGRSQVAGVEEREPDIRSQQ